jgi:hypothetical protein
MRRRAGAPVRRRRGCSFPDAPDASGATLQGGEVGRLLLGPLIAALAGHGFAPEEVAQFQAMLQRGFAALTDGAIQSMELTLA